MAYNAQTQTFVPDENPANFVNGNASSFNPTAITNIANTVPLQQPQSAIPSTSLQPVGAVKIPQVNNNNTTSAGIIGGTQPSVDTALTNFNQAQTAVGTQAEDARSALTKMAESIFGQKADAQANQAKIEEQLGINEQQKALSQINTDIANEQVALRAEEEKLRVGSGSEAQKQISRNTLNDTYGRRLADLAIRQSAANQNITAIQDNAEKKTKLLTAPLDTKIQYLTTFAKDNVDYLDKKQTEKLNFIVDDLKTQKADIQALENAKATMITEIANNGGGTNTQLIARIQNAKNMGEVTSLGASSGFIGKLDRLYKSAQIANIYSEMNERAIKNAPPAAAASGVLDAYSLSKGLLGRDTNAITGIQSLSAFIPGTDAQYTKNQFNQLKGFLSLENRSKLKGQGAVSDFEGKVLERAASALDRNLSDEDFKRELARITGVLGTASGMSVPVQIKDSKTGETKAGLADRNTINAALLNGYEIDYSLPNQLNQ